MRYLDWLKRHPRTVSSIIVAIAALAGVSVGVFDVDGDGQPDRVIIDRQAIPTETKVDGPDPDSSRDDVVELNRKARDVVGAATTAPDSYDLGGNLRGDDPTKAGVITGPLAAQEWPGCRTMFVRSFSGRTSSVKAVGLHYTVSRNVPGWADLTGLTAYSNDVRHEASWHFLIDREGNCAYNVPTKYKAWTIGNLNSQTVNLEIIGMGSEPDYAGPGMAKVRAVVQRIGRLYGIPMRLGAVDGNCNVTRRGVITHWMGGSCAGGHVDIKPYSIAGVVKQIAQDAGPAPSYAILNLNEKRNVSELERRRRIAKRHGGWGNVAPFHLHRAVKAKDALRKSVRWYRDHPAPNRAERAAKVVYLTRVIG